MEKDKLKIDWSYPPPGIDEISLWGSLHDGEIVKCQSDLISRKIQIFIKRVPVLATNNQDYTFKLEFNGVESLRATRFRMPSDKERAYLPTNNQFIGRWESVSWDIFESLIQEDEFEIYHAILINGSTSVCLKIEGGINDVEIYGCNIEIAAQTLSIYDSDDNFITLDKFIELGIQFWEKSK